MTWKDRVKELATQEGFSFAYDFDNEYDWESVYKVLTSPTKPYKENLPKIDLSKYEVNWDLADCYPTYDEKEK